MRSKKYGPPGRTQQTPPEPCRGLKQRTWVGFPGCSCIFGCSENISSGMGGPPDGQRGNWGSDFEIQALHLSVCSLPTLLPPSHTGLPATPLGSSSHGQMPFPSWPAVKSMSWWLCMSPRDPGQMVPVNISCHGAMTSSSLKHVHVRQKWSLVMWHPVSVPILLSHQPSGLHTPTAMPSAQHPPVSPNFPQGEAPLCSC